MNFELNCGSRDVTGALQVSGTITESTVWSGLVHVTGDLGVRNEATLEIEPGTKIIVGFGAEIEFGWEGSAPTLVAKGTVEHPILICGEVKEAGYWSRLVFRESVNPASVMRNLLIEDAGEAGSTGALTLEAPVTLQAVQVRLSESPGVTAADFGSESRELRVAEVTGNPVRFTHARAVSSFPEQSLIDPEGDGFAEVAFETIDESVVFHDIGIPYLQELGVVGSGDDTTVTFEPGVDYRIAESYRLDLDAVDVVAIGAGAPVLFQGPCVDRECDDGGGTLTLGGRGNTRLELVSLVGLGQLSTRGLETLPGSAVSFKNVSLSDSRFRARAPFTPDSENIVVTSVGTALELAHWDALRTLPADTEASTEGTTAVTATFAQIESSGTIKAFSFEVDYGGLEVTNSAHLVLAPGSEIRIAEEKLFFVDDGASLTAIGTAESPVRINGIGSERWSGLHVAETADVTLDHVIVSRSGSYMYPFGNINARGPLSLTNSIVSQSAAWGLLKMADDTTDYATSNTFEGNALGDIGTFP